MKDLSSLKGDQLVLPAVGGTINHWNTSKIPGRHSLLRFFCILVSKSLACGSGHSALTPIFHSALFSNSLFPTMGLSLHCEMSHWAPAWHVISTASLLVLCRGFVPVKWAYRGFLTHKSCHFWVLTPLCLECSASDDTFMEPSQVWMRVVGRISQPWDAAALWAKPLVAWTSSLSQAVCQSHTPIWGQNLSTRVSESWVLRFLAYTKQATSVKYLGHLVGRAVEPWVLKNMLAPASLANFPFSFSLCIK